MPDTAYGAPQAQTGGVGGYFAEHPWAKWVALGGVAALAYFLYQRHRAAGTITDTGGGQTATTTGASYIDPNTGFPYTWSAGQNVQQIGSASSDIGAWTTAALNALKSLGVDPAAAENALYNFENGLALTTQQQDWISKAIAATGSPPGGPFPIVQPPPPPAVAPPQGTYLNPVTWVWNVAAPATVAAGTGLLTNLGFLGRGPIRTPPLGSAIYANVLDPRTKKRHWVRISSLAQYVNLPSGTQIAALRWATPTTAAA